MQGGSSGGAGTCANIRGPGEATSLAISPDGRFAYSVGYRIGKYPGVLAIFHRDTKTGVLTQVPGRAGCWSIDGKSDAGHATCQNARDLTTGDGHSLAISGDGP